MSRAKTLNLTLLLILFVLLLNLCSGGCYGQAAGVPPDNPVTRIKHYLIPLTTPDQADLSGVNIYVNYAPGRILAGAQDVNIELEIQKTRPVNIDLVGISIDGESHSVKVAGEKLGIRMVKDDCVKRNIKLDISAEAAPRYYNVTFKFNWHGLKSSPIAVLPLDVGVTSRGKLETIEKPSNPVSAYPGAAMKGISLNLKNGFANYDINITKIDITSNPPDIVVETHLQNEILLVPDQTYLLPVSAQIRGLSLAQLMSGTTANPTLDIHVHYNDGHNRTIDDWVDHVPLSVDPNYLWMTIAALLGSLIGGLIKIFLPKRVPNREIIGHIMLSVIITMVVFGVAVATKVQVLAFQDKLRASFDNPLVCFLFSLVVALVDPAKIIEILRKMVVGENKNADNR